MHRLTRVVVCGFVFIFALTAEVGVVISLVPREALTTERINEYLLIAMGFAFLPLLLAAALVPVLVALLVGVAYLPARLCWVTMSPRAQRDPAPRERMLKRMAELKTMPPERERSKHAAKPDA